MKILIKVTKEILERSSMCGFDSSVYRVESCAVALAIREIFPRAAVGINNEGIPVICGVGDESIELPRARLFINLFDRSTPLERLTMSPQSFEIDVPSEVIEKIGIGEVYRILSESKTLELVAP